MSNCHELAEGFDCWFTKVTVVHTKPGVSRILFLTVKQIQNNFIFFCFQGPPTINSSFCLSAKAHLVCYPIGLVYRVPSTAVKIPRQLPLLGRYLPPIGAAGADYRVPSTAVKIPRQLPLLGRYLPPIGFL
jgi:hypothetical protein